jgi:hypothetical protein
LGVFLPQFSIFVTVCELRHDNGGQQRLWVSVAQVISKKKKNGVVLLLKTTPTYGLIRGQVLLQPEANSRKFKQFRSTRGEQGRPAWLLQNCNVNQKSSHIIEEQWVKTAARL